MLQTLFAVTSKAEKWFFLNSSQLFKTRISAFFRKSHLTQTKKCLFIEQLGLTQIDLLILAYLLFHVKSSHLLTSKYISPTSNKRKRQHSIRELDIDNLSIWHIPMTAQSRKFLCSNNWLICFSFFYISGVHRLNSFNHNQIQGASHTSFQHYSIAIRHGDLSEKAAHKRSNHKWYSLQSFGIIFSIVIFFSHLNHWKKKSQSLLKAFAKLNFKNLSGYLYLLKWLFILGHLYFLNCATALLNKVIISS